MSIVALVRAQTFVSPHLWIKTIESSPSAGSESSLAVTAPNGEVTVARSGTPRVATAEGDA
jgi:hypothetical protein